MNLIPSFLSSSKEPIPADVVNTRTFRTCYNGSCREFEILQTKNDKMIVNADLYGKRQILTLSENQSKKVKEILESLDEASSRNFSPMLKAFTLPTMFISYRSPEKQLKAIEKYRKELDDYEAELKKIEENKSKPSRTEVLNNLFQTLEGFFAPKP